MTGWTSLAFMFCNFLFCINSHIESIGQGLLYKIMNYDSYKNKTMSLTICLDSTCRRDCRAEKMRFKLSLANVVKYIIFRQYLTHSVRLRGWVLLEVVRVSRSQMGCIPTTAPSLGGDRARWCADCESGRAAGRPGRIEPATEPSHTTEMPGDTQSD